MGLYCYSQLQKMQKSVSRGLHCHFWESCLSFGNHEESKRNVLGKDVCANFAERGFGLDALYCLFAITSSSNSHPKHVERG